MSENRRLAAILVADVAGSSRLIEADEAYALTAVRHIIQDVLVSIAVRLGGRLVKTLGDGAILDFASPVAAVACADEVQRAVAAEFGEDTPDRQIRLRIGINLGDVIETTDGDLYGDGVNIAARLEAITEPGGITISSTVHDHLPGKLAIPWKDGGEVALKNIVRPVRVWALGKTVTSAQPKRPSNPPNPPSRLSVAVLPFVNMSGDPEQDYFADGMVEDIIAALSRIRWFSVTARNSSFIYKGSTVDLRQVGRELGVRYILEGSVRKAGGRVRITSRLMESESGQHVWTGRFDGDLDDVFKLQDQVAVNVVGAIEPSLRTIEIDRVRGKRTDDLGAYDLLLKAQSELYTYNEESLSAADALLRAAVDRDPTYSDAWALIATTSILRVVGGLLTFAEGMVIGGQASRQAESSGSDNPSVLASAAAALAYYGLDFDAAGDLADRALFLAPSSAQVLSLCGFAYNFCMAFDRAMPLLHEARRLSPRDPRGYITTNQIAMAHFFNRRFDEAIDWTKRNLRQQPHFFPSLAFLIAALAHNGRLDEAREVAGNLLQIRPKMRVSTTRLRAWRQPWMAELYASGLRLAGIPEDVPDDGLGSR